MDVTLELTFTSRHSATAISRQDDGESEGSQEEEEEDWDLLKYIETFRKAKTERIELKTFPEFSRYVRLVLLDVQFNHFNGGSIRPGRKCWQIPTCDAKRKVILWFCGPKEEAKGIKNHARECCTLKVLSTCVDQF